NICFFLNALPLRYFVIFSHLVDVGQESIDDLNIIKELPIQKSKPFMVEWSHVGGCNSPFEIQITPVNVYEKSMVRYSRQIQIGIKPAGHIAVSCIEIRVCQINV